MNLDTFQVSFGNQESLLDSNIKYRFSLSHNLSNDLNPFHKSTWLKSIETAYYLVHA